MVEYYTLSLVVIIIYALYLNHKVRYRITLSISVAYMIIVGFLSVYQRNQIEHLLNKDIFGDFILIVHVIFGVIIGFFIETLYYQFKNPIKYKFMKILLNISLIVVYVLLSFKIDFFLTNF